MLNVALGYTKETPLPTDWHLSYGMTHRRESALRRNGDNSDNSNSFFNGRSETVLTLSLLGMLDGWKQIGTLVEQPRRGKDGKWNRRFFQRLRRSEDLYHSGSSSTSHQPRWNRLDAAPFNNRSLDFFKSVVVFEFEALNSAFNRYNNATARTFRKLSFLELGERRKKWSQYDAALFQPPSGNHNGLIVGIEAKLTSDSSLQTTEFSNVNQIVRNLEAGYWMTHHPESQYEGWDFHYVFICPEDAIKYQSTFYGYALSKDGGIPRLLNNYHGILRDTLSRCQRKDASEKFEDFKNWSTSAVSVLYWRDLASAISDNGSVAFFNRYIERLAPMGRDRELAKATAERLQAAGIPVDDVK